MTVSAPGPRAGRAALKPEPPARAPTQRPGDGCLHGRLRAHAPVGVRASAGEAQALLLQALADEVAVAQRGWRDGAVGLEHAVRVLEVEADHPAVEAAGLLTGGVALVAQRLADVGVAHPA